MKILYDHQIFNIQQYGGISRYFYELISRLREQVNIETVLSVKYSDNSYIENDIKFNIKGFTKSRQYGDKYSEDILNKFIKKKIDIENRIIERINEKRKQSNIINSKKLLSKFNYEIFHPTYYDTYFLDLIHDKQYVMTVHDMIHEIYYGGQIIEDKKRLIRNAAKIIAVSENTKKDIIELCDIEEDKIHVIYHGNSLKADHDICFEDLNLPEKYLLFIGNRNDYKNFKFFAKAIVPLLDSHKELYIVCGGGGLFSVQETAYLKSLHIEDRVTYRYIFNDDVLVCLYKNASAFVYPSLYEGFGIPILEAFSCGCPVVLSDSSSLPEIAQNAGCFFDPTNEESMRETILRVIDDNELQKKMVMEGFQQLKKYSWENTANQTLELYKSIL